MMREPVEADDLLVRSIQPTRSNSFNNEGENDLRMLPWFIDKNGSMYKIGQVPVSTARRRVPFVSV